MVTPVHRFQAIESACGRTSSGRQNRGPAFYHARFLARTHGNRETADSGQEENAISNNSDSNTAISSASTDQQQTLNTHHRNVINRSTDVISQRGGTTIVPRMSTSTARLKCGVWAFFVVATFFIAGAKFFFYGGNLANEGLAFCTILIVILIVGGSVSLYESVVTYRARRHQCWRNPGQISSEQMETNGGSMDIEVPDEGLCAPAEVPPPPYHIAIMLPAHQEDSNEPLQIIRRDSPPPTYEKAVT